MATFTVRFELKNETYSDYIIVQNLLFDLKFRKTIKGENGQKYILPHGEYRITGEYTSKQVLDLAASAIEKVGKEYRLMVTRSAGTAWVGLPLA